MAALLHEAAVLAREEGEVLGAVLLHVGELAEDLADERLADAAHGRVVLEHLAGDVERQVGALHDAAHEREVAGEQLLDVVADEDAAHVELQAELGVRVEQVVGRGARDEHERLELGRALGGDADRGERGLAVVGDVLVERLDLLGRRLGLGLLPDGLHGVDLLGLLRLGVLVLFVRLLARVGAQEDRIGEVVRVGADELLEAPRVEVLLRVVAQVQDDRRAVGRVVVRGLQVVLALAVGGPLHAVGAAAAGRHVHAVGDHERGVEADAELADELGRAGLVLHRLQEALRAGGGDGAEVRLDLPGGHADAVVGDRERAGPLVRDELDAVVRIGGLRLVREALEAGAVDRVGGVGEQLAEEHLLLGVERMDHQIEHLADFGLELLFHGRDGQDGSDGRAVGMAGDSSRAGADL